MNSTTSGIDTEQLISEIKATETGGGTNIYKPVERALEILEDFDDDDYTKSIVLMTDGESGGEFRTNTSYHIPVFSIMFGEANPKQLDEISRRTKGRTFDGRIDLIQAFKEIRGYN